MGELLDAFIVLLLLFGSAWVGMFVKGRLAERHRSKETSELVGLVILMLVTFAALVMSLLIFSVKGSFDQDDTDMAAIAGNIVRLDQCLRNYGPETRSMQAGLRSYTAAVIASTWPGEPKPSGSYYPQRAPPLSVGGMENRGLGRTVNRIRIGLHRLDPHSAFHSRVAQSCLEDFQSLEVARWKVIEEAHPTISLPFYVVLVFWLMVIFACFGLNAPRNAFSLLMMALCAISISSAVFVILDMDAPFTGPISISSQPMRNALSDISLPPQ